MAALRWAALNLWSSHGASTRARDDLCATDDGDETHESHDTSASESDESVTRSLPPLETSVTLDGAAFRPPSPTSATPPGRGTCTTSRNARCASSRGPSTRARASARAASMEMSPAAARRMRAAPTSRRDARLFPDCKGTHGAPRGPRRRPAGNQPLRLAMTGGARSASASATLRPRMAPEDRVAAPPAPGLDVSRPRRCQLLQQAAELGESDALASGRRVHGPRATRSRSWAFKDEAKAVAYHASPRAAATRTRSTTSPRPSRAGPARLVDKAQAARLFKRAAERGHSRAAANLANLADPQQ